MNIYEKLLEVSKSVSYLQKENKGKQYSYVSSSQTLSAVKSKMDEMGLLLEPEITGYDVREKEELKEDGKITITYFTSLIMNMTWVNVDKPEEKITKLWYAQGVDIAGEKGVGKALTYAEKYFILKYFHIATDKDDLDSYQEKNNIKKHSSDQIIEEIITKYGECKTVEELSGVKEYTRKFASVLSSQEIKQLIDFGKLRYAEITVDQTNV